MQQEINLYNYLPKKSGFDLTPKIVSLSYGGFLLLLLMFYLTALWQKHVLTTQWNELTNAVSLHQQELATLTQKYPVSDPANLQETVRQLQKEYEKKSYIIDLLSPYATFSSYLVGLGDAIIPGIWLTQITFDRGEIKIALKGFTLQPVLLARFFTALAMQPVFSDLTFELNNINQTNFPASFYITAKKANKV